MISSTVRLPTIERRWPAKMRPHSSSMLSCSARNRRAAFAIEPVSSPILKKATACRFRGMPCLVTHGSMISDSLSASDSTRAFCLIGMTNAPWPVTIRNCDASLCLDPDIRSASSGAGTCQKSMDPPLLQWGNRDRPCGAVLNDDNAHVLLDRFVRESGKGLGATSHRDDHLARSIGRDRNTDMTDLADEPGIRFRVIHGKGASPFEASSHGPGRTASGGARAKGRFPEGGLLRGGLELPEPAHRNPPVVSGYKPVREYSGPGEQQAASPGSLLRD